MRAQQDTIAGLKKNIIEWGVSDEASLKVRVSYPVAFYHRVDMRKDRCPPNHALPWMGEGSRGVVRMHGPQVDGQAR